MDERILIGQRFSIGFHGTELDDSLKQILHESKIGNIILFRHNIESFEQLQTLCRELDAFIKAETGYRPFIMIDEECGAVSRLAPIAGDTPSAMTIGQTGDPENARRIARQIGKRLRAVGINFNLAPVLDCFTNKNGISSGNRCFGEAPIFVADMGEAYLRGLQETGILTCCKHFPGAGDTAVDAHLALPVIRKSLENLEQLELVPFRRAIAAGTEAIMSAHIVLPALESREIPATLSRAVMTGLLRERLGFEGILVSDSLEMRAVADLVGFEEAARMAFDAGVDIALICHDPEAAARAAQAQLEFLKKGTLDEEAAKQSFNRILAHKRTLPAASGSKADFRSPAYIQEAENIMRASVMVLPGSSGTVLRRPDAETAFLGAESFRASQAGDNMHLYAAQLLSEHYGGHWVQDLNCIPEGIRKAVIIAEYVSDPNNGLYADIARELLSRGVHVTVVSMFTPTVLEQFPEEAVRICMWQYDSLSVKVLTELLDRQEA